MSHGPEADHPSHFEGKAHVLPVRIYYEDTDAGTIVYYANYLKYAERGRTEMLRELGLESATILADHGVALAVHHCSADYLRPARLDDLLEVHTEVERVGGASLELKQMVKKDGIDLVEMHVRLVCMNIEEAKAERMPDYVREAFIKLMNGKKEG